MSDLSIKRYTPNKVQVPLTLGLTSHYIAMGLLDYSITVFESHQDNVFCSAPSGKDLGIFDGKSYETAEVFWLHCNCSVKLNILAA